jgi:hypothetical protein
MSYLALFDELRSNRGLPASDLSFVALEGVAVTPSDLGLEYSDI